MESEDKSEDQGFIDLLLGREPQEEPSDPTEPIEPVEPSVPTEPIEPTEPVAPVEPGVPVEPTNVFDLNKLNDEQMLAAFRKITGTEATLDEAKRYRDVLGELDKTKDIREKFPLVLEKFKQSKDVLSYFEDETAYKASQLAKEERFMGKKGAVEELLRSDLKLMGITDIVELYSKLYAPKEAKDPFRYIVRGLGLDPTVVREDYDNMEDDQKEDFEVFAAKARKELSAIGTDIEIPKILTDDIEKMLTDELTAKKEDFNGKREQIMPVSLSYVGELKELKVTDDFTFKLDLSEDAKKDYAGFMTDLVQSGEYNVSTDEGKQGLHQAVMDEIILDHWPEILKAHTTHIRTAVEQEFRKKYNNETPFDDKTKKPEESKEEIDPMQQLIREMIAERK